MLKSMNKCKTWRIEKMQHDFEKFETITTSNHQIYPAATSQLPASRLPALRHALPAGQRGRSRQSRTCGRTSRCSARCRLPRHSRSCGPPGRSRATPGPGSVCGRCCARPASRARDARWPGDATSRSSGGRSGTRARAGHLPTRGGGGVLLADEVSFNKLVFVGSVDILYEVVKVKYVL